MNVETHKLIFEGSHSLIYLVYSPDYPQPVILKVLKKEQPSLQQLVQFHNEYDFTADLKISGIRGAYGKTQHHHQAALILEYIKGQTLKEKLEQGPLPLAEALQLFITLSQTLSEIHQQGIVHKDLNPANILLSAHGPYLIDFGLASRWDLKVSYQQPLEQLEGTLAYLAPEQTGRMNRLVDARSDLYALGISLFETLTGHLPFEAQDSIGWVHAHLARTPPDLQTHKPELPQTLAQIVSKLMAKNAENRYQSAAGLQHDLKQILSGEQDFILAQADTPTRLQIPQQLYGRDAETAELLKAFSRVRQGSFELLLIAGASGVGKSALVQQIQRPLTEFRAHFISSKFDQLQRNIPYSVFTQAFGQLCDQLLSRDESELKHWRQRIVTALGNNAQVLIEIIPKLESLIGPQPAVTVLPPKEASNRFALYFGYFVQALCSPEHPLVIFIDDLQWADAASLELLKLLCTSSPKHLLVLGAYRKNEISPRHPFRQALTHLQTGGTPVKELELNNLSPQDLSHFLTDTLQPFLNKTQAHPAHLEDSEIIALRDLIQAKTHGNAFFVRQFLKTLYTDQLLVYSAQERRWRGNIQAIKASQISDNVVDFMAAKLAQLPETTQRILKLAASIGSSFDLATLTNIASAHDTAQALPDALAEGLIMPQSNVYQLRSLLTDPHSGQNLRESYRFVHDRVQQAAYALIPAVERPALHLNIARRLLTDSQALQGKQLFDIVEHFHLGLPLLQTVAERLEVARLSLLAGERAKLSAAYESAFTYLATGITCLGADAWQQDYELTFGLYHHGIEAAYVSGHFETMDIWTAIVLEHSPVLLDRVKIYELKISCQHARYQLEEAVLTGLEVLELLGIRLPRDPQTDDLFSALNLATEALNGRGPEDLIQLPLMSPETLATGMGAAIRIMYMINLSAFFFRPLLYPVIVAHEMALIARYGNVPESAFVYCTYAMILCGVVGDIPLGTRFAAASRHLLTDPAAKAVECRTLMVLGNGALHWSESLYDFRDDYLRAFQLGLETGDLEFAAQAAQSYCFMGLYAGVNLQILDRDMRQQMAAIEQLQVMTTLQYMRLYYQATLSLYTPLPEPWRFKGPVYDEDEMLPVHQAAKDITAVCVLYFHKLMTAYLFEAHAEGLIYAQKALETLEAIACVPHMPLYHTYDALNRLALCQNLAVDSTERATHLEIIHSHLNKLQHWGRYAPQNYGHKHKLVAAELAALEQQTDQALNLYEQALTEAHQHRFLQDEALVYECLGKFWLRKGHTRQAAQELKEASRLYGLWGASEKVRQLEQRYRELLTQTALAGRGQNQSLASSQNEAQFRLDHLSLLKSTRAISQEIDLGALLARLLEIVLENAGAERGWLLLPESHELYVEAVCNAQGQPTLFTHTPLAHHPELPQAPIQYVLRTAEPVVLADASRSEAFAHDPQIRTRGIRSLLVMSVKTHNQLSLLLVLEHRQLRGVFTPERLELLNLLLSQAAVSLNNARLYHSLETEVALRTRELVSAKEAAEKANLAKSSFIANMNHELRTPLNAILGFSHLLVNEAELSYDQTEKLNIIMRSGEHLLHLINDTLEMSAIEAGRIQLQSSGFDLELFLTEIREVMALKAAEKQLGFSFEIPADLPRYIQADQGKLRQLLLNLLSNAIKYTREGGVKLQVSWRPEPESFIRLGLSVADTGIGMAEADLKTIFKPFVQLDTGNLSQGGVGLGLAISQKFVELMGGSLQVESRPDEGSRFSCELSVLTLTSPTPSRSRSSTRIPKPGQLAHRVLVVDDETFNRRLLESYLVPLGLDVRLATNGQEALQICAEWPPALIFMDLHMPVLDGFATAQQLKQQTDPPLIIAVTASAQPEDHDRALALGCDAFLNKPLHLDQVLELLENYLQLEFIEAPQTTPESDNHKPIDLLSALEQVPEMLLTQLLQATELGNIQQTESQLSAISAYAPELAQALSQQAARFDYDAIILLLRRYQALNLPENN